MTRKLEPSRQRSDVSAPINPYEASLVTPPDLLRQAESDQERNGTKRQYRVRMEWSAARLFLPLALPLRIGAVAGGLMVAYGLYGFFTTLHGAWLEGVFDGSRDVAWMLKFLFTPVRSAIILWMCWLYWQLADAIVATAGGASSSMEEWSRIQSRLVWSMIVALIVAVLSIGWDRILPFVLSRMPL